MYIYIYIYMYVYIIVKRKNKTTFLITFKFHVFPTLSSGEILRSSYFCRI